MNNRISVHQSPFSVASLSVFFVVLFALTSLSACSDRDSGAASSGFSGIPEGNIDSATMRSEMISTLAEKDKLDRVTRLVGLLHRLNKDNLEGALEAHEESLPALDRDEIKIFANAWARIDAKGALDRVRTWRNPVVTRGAVAEIVYYWTLNGGAEDARKYALSSVGRSEADTETTRNVIMDSVIRGLAGANEHDELTEILENFPSDRTRGWLLTQAMLEHFRSGIPAVQTWVDSIPWDAKNNLKLDALAPALSTISKADGEAAAAWYERLESKLDKGALLEDVVSDWAIRDPQAAIEWLRKRPQSASRSKALRKVSFMFLKQEGPKASEWIQANLDDSLIDMTMRFPLAQYLVSVDIHEALPIAEKIGKTNEKSNVLKQILMIWSRDDYDAVKQYMAEVGVPADVEKTVIGQNQIRKKKKTKRASSSAEQG